MFKIQLTVFLFCLCIACSPPPQYAWQDTRTPPRDDVSTDLQTCRDFTARQYRPGVPTGEEYIKENDTGMELEETSTQGTWRPDRSPVEEVNTYTTPRHDIPVDYTGYPGELDYYPHYLDDILEKCMRDKGWVYSEVQKNQ